MTFTLRLLVLCTVYSYVISQCDDNGVIYTNGDKWIRNNHFLVTCRDGNIQVNLISIGYIFGLEF